VGTRDNDRVEVSHLLFADDTLVFCGADASQINYMGALLVCFEAVSGLKVNLTKFLWSQLALWMMWISWLEA
jgi:hypothetical protein